MNKLEPKDLEAAIKQEFYHQFPGTTLTVCALLLRNGYVVVGESACASTWSFNANKGKEVARSHAVSKMWALLGYQLREDEYRAQPLAPEGDR